MQLACPLSALSDGECSPLFTLLGPEMAIFKPGERVNPGVLTS